MVNCGGLVCIVFSGSNDGRVCIWKCGENMRGMELLFTIPLVSGCQGNVGECGENMRGMELLFTIPLVSSYQGNVGDRVWGEHGSMELHFGEWLPQQCDRCMELLWGTLPKELSLGNTSRRHSK